MSETIYLIIMLVLPIALNISVWLLVHHTKQSVTVATIVMYLFGPFQVINDNDGLWPRSRKTVRNSLHLLTFPAMHVLFWVCSGMHPIAHIAALIANLMYWVITNRFVLAEVADTIVKLDK
jgi:hypothetical protein